MKRIIEKFYAAIFEDSSSEEPVPFANKQFMFWFSIVSFLIVLFFIIKDIVKNINSLNP